MSRSNVLLLIITVQILLAALCVSAAPQYWTLDARQPSGEASAEEIEKIIKSLGQDVTGAAANDESFALAA